MLGPGMWVVVGSWLAAMPADRVATRPDPTPIIGGQETEPGELDSVVAIVMGTNVCTGTVVSKTVVLTAAHCLANLRSGQEVWVYWGQDLDANRRVQVERWGVHPDFCADCDEDVFDYGFVEIGAKFIGIDLMVPVATQDEWDATIYRGADVLVVGYGKDPDLHGLDQGLGTKRRVSTTISKFTSSGLEFWAGGDDRDSCEGDSGGPAFVRMSDGTLRLAGITSRGSTPCGEGGYYATVYPALCWLADETGVDLRRDGCDTCDCLDTAQPDDEGACRIGGGTPRPNDAWLWLSLGVVGLLRRRSHGRGR